MKWWLSVHSCFVFRWFYIFIKINLELEENLFFCFFHDTVQYFKLIARNLKLRPKYSNPGHRTSISGCKSWVGAGLANVHGINFSPRLFAAKKRLTMGHFPRGGEPLSALYFGRPGSLQRILFEFLSVPLWFYQLWHPRNLYPTINILELFLF